MNSCSQRVRAALSIRRWEIARREAERGLAEDAESSELLTLLGFALLASGELAEAEQRAREAAGIAPDWSEPFRLLAHVKLEIVRKTSVDKPSVRNVHLRQGCEAARSALMLDPDDPDNYFVMALLRGLDNDVQDARNHALWGLAIDARHAGGLRALAWVESLHGHKDIAIDRYREALAIDPLDASGHHLLAECLYDRNEFAEARRHVALAVELDPADDDIVRAYQHYVMTQSRLVAGLARLENGLKTSSLLRGCWFVAGVFGLPFVVHAVATWINPATADGWLVPAIVAGWFGAFSAFHTAWLRASMRGVWACTRRFYLSR
jgi:tetratricopeptide (TPR) repeat protein